MADINELIANAQERADSLTEAAIKMADWAPSQPALEDVGLAVYPPSLRGSVPAYTGNVDITAEIYRMFQDGFAEFKPEMLDALADYIARFFPACVYASTNDWICNTILYGGTGIPADIEAQIWMRARARETAEASKLKDVATLQFANRGFSMPAGVLAARLLEVEQEASNKSSTLSRDIAIKQAEIEIENIRIAVQEGVKVRASVIAGISDYIRAYLLPINLANERATALAQAKSVFMNSAADYYRAMVAEAELTLRANVATADNTTQMRASYNTAISSYTNALTSTVTNAVDALAQTAGQAAGAAITLAGDTQTRTVAAGA
jgi:hypothetical protein